MIGQSGQSGGPWGRWGPPWTTLEDKAHKRATVDLDDMWDGLQDALPHHDPEELLKLRGRRRRGGLWLPYGSTAEP